MRATSVAALLGLALCAVAVMAQTTGPSNVVWSSDGCVETVPGIALSVMVQGLRPNTEYVIKVAAYTRAKGAASPATTIARTLTTCISAVPGPVGNIYLTSTDVATTWRLSWLAPTSGGCVGDYYVDVVTTDTNQVVLRSAARTAELAIPNLVAGTSYNFRVFARNNFGWGPGRRATYTIPASVTMRPLGKGAIVEETEKHTELEPAPTAEAGRV